MNDKCISARGMLKRTGIDAVIVQDFFGSQALREYCRHYLAAHILQIDLYLVLGTSYRSRLVLRWQSLVSQTTHCERPVSLIHVFNQQRPLALHFFKTKKYFTVELDLWAPVFMKTLQTKKVFIIICM